MTTQTVNVGAQAIRQAIIYKEPLVAGSAMPDTTIASKFEALIYSRSLLVKLISRYKAAGWQGLTLLYFDIVKNSGPAGLSSLAAQKSLSTSAQKSISVHSNTITMDTGEMCRIHDAIIQKGTLDGLPVSEGWFMHRSDGSRYEEPGGGAAQYRMNFANADYRKYYINKLNREFNSVDPNHLPTGAQGLFLDNANISWTLLMGMNGGKPPMEFADKAAYQLSVKTFISEVRSAFPNIKIWANMTAFSANPENFTDFKPYLDGAMIESAFLDWSLQPRPVDKIESGNTMVDSWGKPLLYVVQGDKNGAYHAYTFGLYLLVVSDNAYFFYTDKSNYANYYEIPEYKLTLGAPLGARQKVSSGVWRRQFEHGTVQVDINTRTATFTVA